MRRPILPFLRDSTSITIGVVFIAVCTFASGVANPLMLGWDDGSFIVDNPDARDISLATLQRIFTSVRERSFQPLHWLSYWIDVPWFGPQPFVLHTVNLAWWCIDLILLLRVMRSLGLELIPAACATLLFGLHPIQVEVVSWAAGRKDIVALMFVCVALLLHARRSPSARILSSAAYLCACLSKTVTVPLPLVLILADTLLYRTSVRRAVLGQLVNLIVTAVLGSVVIWIWSSHDMIRTDMAGSEAGSLPVRVAATITHYLGTFVWPAKLSPQYAQLREARLEAWMLVGPAVLFAALVYAWRARDREVAFALLAFIVLFAPVSNAIPLYFQWQDRYLCMPMLPVAYGAGISLQRLLARVERPALVWVGVLLGIVALGARTAQYTEAWSSERRLWEHAVATQPEAFFAWIKLGELHRDERRLAASIAAYDRAIAISPQSRLASTARIFTLGLRDEARQSFKGPSRALGFSQRYYAAADDPTALRKWSDELIALGYRALVIAVFDRSLELDPVSRERLRAAARAQNTRGNEWLAAYFEQKARALAP